MANISKISWTDGTLNFWEGCTMISDGCAHCYAKDRDDRYHDGQHWGKGAPRKKSVSAIQNCSRFSKNAADGRFIRCLSCGMRRWRSDVCCGAEGGAIIRPTMFVMSLGDFGDAEVPDEWRAEALTEMIKGDAVDYMVLSKRPEAMPDLFAKAALLMTPHMRERVMNWLEGADIPPNIAMGATVEGPKVAEQRLFHLANFPAARRFISAEPLLGGSWAKRLLDYDRKFHLLIAGGESGPKARPMHPSWPLQLEKICDEAAIPYHFKQWGQWAPAQVVPPDFTKPVAGNFVVLSPDGSIRACDPAMTSVLAPDVLMWRAGKEAAGHSCDASGRTRTELLAFPSEPWKNDWWTVDLPRVDRKFPGLVPAQEFAAANPTFAPVIKKMDGFPTG